MPPKQEEEIDIDLNDPEVEAAAAKIQAKFRSKKMFGKKSQPPKQEVAIKKRCLRIRGSHAFPDYRIICVDLNVVLYIMCTI